MLHIKLELTKNGLDKAEEIVCLFFRYIDLLRKAGPQEWLWKEFQFAYDLKNGYYGIWQFKLDTSFAFSLSQQLLVFNRMKCTSYENLHYIN